MSPAVTVDLERWGRAKIAGALALVVVIGGGALLAAATGGVSGGSASTVIAVVLGALVLVIGLGCCVPLLVSPPHATVTVDAAGVRHTRGRRADWTLSWTDIGAVTVTHSAARVEQRGVSNTGGFQHPSTDVTLARDWLRLRPTVAAAARPEIARAVLHESGADDPAAIALDLGPDARSGAALRAAVEQFAPPAIRR